MISDIKCNRIQEPLKISNLFSLTKYDIKWDEIDHKWLKYTKVQSQQMTFTKNDRATILKILTNYLYSETLESFKFIRKAIMKQNDNTEQWLMIMIIKMFNTVYIIQTAFRFSFRVRLFSSGKKNAEVLWDFSWAEKMQWCCKIVLERPLQFPPSTISPFSDEALYSPPTRPLYMKVTMPLIRPITLHYFTLQYNTLHYITLHYITLHYIT